MMQNPLKIAPPPRRPVVVEAEPQPEPEKSSPTATAMPEPKPARRPAAPPAAKFRQMKEDERVQFNKRVTRRVADGFEMLAIRSRRRVPELLAEALELLEDRYGRVG
jgi:hypothetical protein